MFEVLRLEDWRDTRHLRHSARPPADGGAVRGVVVVVAVIGLVLWALMIAAYWLWWA